MTGKKETGEERKQSTDFKEMRAALLRLFRGQHGQKNGFRKGNARGNWSPREDQQPFRPNPNGVGDPTITLRRLLIDTAIL